jgi:hypothetical protein
MTKPQDYYFQLFEDDGHIGVSISPKDFTDKEQCCYDNHLGDSINNWANQLPFLLSEDCECQFSIWDWSGEKQAKISTFAFIRTILIKTGLHERITPPGAAW